MTIWGHIRLAGAVVQIVGCLMNQWILVLIGFFIQWGGVLGGLDKLERRQKEQDETKVEK